MLRSDSYKACTSSVLGSERVVDDAWASSTSLSKRGVIHLVCSSFEPLANQHLLSMSERSRASGGRAHLPCTSFLRCVRTTSRFRSAQQEALAFHKEAVLGLRHMKAGSYPRKGAGKGKGKTGRAPARVRCDTS
eukprot:154776-Amphidinium_carterae.1